MRLHYDRSYLAAGDAQRSVSLEIIAWEAYIIVVYLCLGENLCSIKKQQNK